MRNTSNPIYYVYILFDWLGIPRYVGKGKGKRWLSHERHSDSSNQAKNEFIEQTYVMIAELPKVKVRENISQNEAFKIEIALIKVIGRLDKGTGPLVNMTDGGDGGGGMSEEARIRMSKAVSYGIMTKLTPEQRSDKARRANASLTQEERSERAKRQNNAQTSKERSNRQKRANAALTPEERKARARRAHESKTPEERSAIAKKRITNKTPDELSDAAKRGAASITPERRSEIGYKREAAKTPEERRNKILKIHAKRTIDEKAIISEKQSKSATLVWTKRSFNERIEIGQRISESLTYEERSERSKRAWITRRKNKEDQAGGPVLEPPDSTSV